MTLPFGCLATVEGQIWPTSTCRMASSGNAEDPISTSDSLAVQVDATVNDTTNNNMCSSTSAAIDEPATAAQPDGTADTVSAVPVTPDAETNDSIISIKEGDIKEQRIDDEAAFSSDDAAAFSSDDDQSVETGSDDGSDDAKGLLERAQDRMAMQNLRDEVDTLKAVIERKNAEIEGLSGQLRRAVNTKNALVEAHSQLEEQHEKSMQASEASLKQQKQANSSIVEAHYAAEKELLNDIMHMTSTVKNLESKHRQELLDKDRKHNNAMLEKDFEIAQLQEEVRKNKVALSEKAAKEKKEGGGFAGFTRKV